LHPPPNAVTPVVRFIAYSETEVVEKSGATIAEIADARDTYPVLWVDVAGLGDASLIQELGELFGFHRLALEDVFNTHQRPKVEEFTDHLFLIARMVDDTTDVDTEQMAFFLGRNFLVTFQEYNGDCLDQVRARIRDGKGRIRRSGPDYLCYAVIDGIIDDYFPVLEACGDKLENIEDRIVANPESRHIKELHDLKRDLLVLRRAIWPHREMINALIRDEHELFAEATRIYLRDGYDHTVQLMDIVETYREIASGLVDVYISSMSARLNEIMKVLAVVGTIFMPLSFIASYYGMNFDTKASPWNLPELGWRYGNLFALALMITAAVGMVWYFAHKRWIERPWRQRRRK
jgi:magnesium transporter